MDDREQVRQAALYLDEIKPGWWRNVDPLTLDLNDTKLCVCGQSGLDWADHEPAMDALLGSNQGVFVERDLEPLWLEEIAERMPAHEPVPA